MTPRVLIKHAIIKVIWIRMYFNLTITLTENENSITIPMYESFDFDDEGKILFLQYYGDLTSAILSLEE